jgi:hypothetical protein
MPFEKLTRILKAKSPFSPEEIEGMTEAEGWDWVYSHASPRKEKLPSICFTGFSQSDKDELSALATGARLRVVGSVNKSLFHSYVWVTIPGLPSLSKRRSRGLPL